MMSSTSSHASREEEKKTHGSLLRRFRLGPSRCSNTSRHLFLLVVFLGIASIGSVLFLRAPRLTGSGKDPAALLKQLSSLLFSPCPKLNPGHSIFGILHEEKESGPPLPKRLAASRGCFKLADYFEGACPEWKQYPFSEGENNTGIVHQDNVTLTFPAEALLSTKQSVTIGVRLGRKRAALWLREFLPVVASECDVVKEVLLDWWSAEPIPADLQPLMKGFSVPVRVVPGRRELGDRFAIVDHVSTDFVLNLDDDRAFSCDSIRRMVLAGRHFPGKLIGPSDLGRGIMRCPTTGYLKYTYAAGYDNFVLNGAALIPADTMRAYFAMIPKALISLEHHLKTCQDVFLYFTAASLNNNGIMAVKVLNVESLHHNEFQYQMETSISQHVSVQQWYRERSACLNLILEVLPVIPNLSVLAIIKTVNDENGVPQAENNAVNPSHEEA
eukprot:GHVS01010578.1.p1 GENE.GHVS01010578.1~~GHVS01010578.1.p1  ORF type:complete len:442 (-),score=25.49 GHVS01010578.1:344-1669(-)